MDAHTHCLTSPCTLFVHSLCVTTQCYSSFACSPRQSQWHTTSSLVKKRCRTLWTCVTDVESVETSLSRPTLDNLLHNPHKRRYIFFGGKGGVGKTTSAAAVALRMADHGLNTLIISTDPAHSLGDALNCDLSDAKMHKIPIDGTLYAIESDPTEAVNEFRELVARLNKVSSHVEKETAADDTTEQNGANGTQQKKQSRAWKSIAKRLGLEDFGDILDTVPPGADELIALMRVLNLVEREDANINFDRVIIDTAPTGHTLRLLAFPDFLDKFLTKALALRKRLNSARGMFTNVTKMFLGADRNVDLNSALENASSRIARYRDRMIELSDLFRDPERAEFVVVSIPTVLAVEESKRLIDRLWDEGIWVRHVIANQVLPKADPTAIDSYLQRLRKGQARQIAFATERIADEYGLLVSTVPLFDTEVRGIYALRALGRVAFANSRTNNYGTLFESEQQRDATVDGTTSKFVFVGGKGGVGKTSISAAMAVALADRGMKTLVLSTDPAHSLSDAFDVSLSGGAPVPVGSVEMGNLHAMEIDTAGAVAQFQAIVKDFASDGRRGVGADIARNLGLDEFADLLENAPPGIDELVALTEVMELVEYGDFDRVVVDTAPTGHTLRLLSFPDFLDNFLGKLVRLKQRLDSAIDTLRSVLGRKETAAAVDKAAERVDRFRKNMTALSALIADETCTQFVLVTIPTGLAMAESERLAQSLRKDGVYTRNLVINQVIPDSSAATFVDRIVDAQDDCIEQLTRAGEEKNIMVTRVPSFDVEVRGVYGLRAMGASLFRD